MLINYLVAGLVANIVLPSTVCLIFPAFTIRLLYAAKCYRKNSLFYELIEEVDEGGKTNLRARYLFKPKNGTSRNETFRVMACMFLIGLPIFEVAALLLYGLFVGF